MNKDTHDDWEKRLEQHMSELSRERLPSALLEERTVRALRSRGILRHKRRLPVAWLTGSIAAALALFATGVVVGQYLGTRNAAGMFARLQHNDNSNVAQVREAGTAYVQALQTLVQQSRGQDAPRAREVALTALHQAANEIVRLAPNDPVAASILQGIERDQKQQQTRAGRATQRQIVWF